MVNATAEFNTIALKPSTEKLDIKRRPEILPRTVISDLLKPYIRLLVETSRVAGPGVAVANKAIEQNANQLSISMTLSFTQLTPVQADKNS